MKIHDLIIKIADESNVLEITQLFHDTIQSVNRKDYPQDEVDDWSSWYTDTERWKEKLSQQYFIIATYNEIIVGFSSLAADGYLDYMFVHKDFQRQGIAHKLLMTIEEKAIDQNNQYIYSDVSITARPFFESHGFCIEKQQMKKSRNKELINFRMIKYL